MAGALAGVGAMLAPQLWPSRDDDAARTPDRAAAAPELRQRQAPTANRLIEKGAGRHAHFSLCHRGGGTNCVVDGDTFWMDGVKIRIADIDTPETHPPRCPEEARLGREATLKLQALLNEGPVDLAVPRRDTDRYGRKLRVVLRDGESLGDRLVADGLARKWTGRREPWCA